MTADSTRDVAGNWRWSATRVGESSPFVSCTLSLADGVFDIVCPVGQVPRSAGAGCMQLRDDRHIHGTIVGVVTGQLDGMIDNLVEYDGESCVTYGYTVGAPYPLPAFAQIAASRVEPAPLAAFLHDLGGRWDWSLTDARTPDAGFTCVVHVGLALLEDPPGVNFEVACPTGPETEPVPGCTSQPVRAVRAHLLPGMLDGDIADERHNEGAGCGEQYPPVSERQVSATMQARPQK